MCGVDGNLLKYVLLLNILLRKNIEDDIELQNNSDNGDYTHLAMYTAQKTFYYIRKIKQNVWQNMWQNMCKIMLNSSALQCRCSGGNE